MIVTKEFIWYVDHYVCHITKEKNMTGIIERGLIPLNGERCKSVLDTRKGVFFLDGMHHIEDWAQVLYEKHELEALKILRFNLKRRKWYIDSSQDFALGFYLPYKVSPEKISYLDIRDKNGDELPLNEVFDLGYFYMLDESFNGMKNNEQISVDDCSLTWKPVLEYKKIKRL